MRNLASNEESAVERYESLSYYGIVEEVRRREAPMPPCIEIIVT